MIEFRTKKGKIRAKGGVNMLMKSPLFSTDQLVGTYSYPFEHPLFSSENKTFSFPGRIEAQRSETSLSGDLFVKGIHISSGDLQLQKANKNSASSYFKGEISRFVKYFGTAYLDELDLGTLTFENQYEMLAYLNDSAWRNHETHPFKLPYLKAVKVVDVDEFGLNETFANPEIINWMDEEGNYKLNDGAGKKYILCPMLYITYVFKKLFESINFRFIDNVFDRNYPLSDLVIVSLKDLQTSDAIASTFGVNIRLRKFLPHYKISDFLIDFQNALETAFIFNDKDSTVTLSFKKDLLKQLKPALKVQHSTVYSNQNKYISGIRFSQSFDDTIMAAASSDALTYAPYFSEPPAAADFQYRILDNHMYGFYMSLPTGPETWGWIQYNNYEPVKKSREEGEEVFHEIKTNLGFLHDLMNENYCAISSSLDNAKNLKPTVLFNRIRQQIFDGMNTIWAVPSFNKAADATYFTESGFENLHRNWFEFLKNSKYIETRIVLTNAQLAAWNWLQPILVDGVQVLPDELEPSILGYEKVVCEFRGYTI